MSEMIEEEKLQPSIQPIESIQSIQPKLQPLQPEQSSLPNPEPTPIENKSVPPTPSEVQPDNAKESKNKEALIIKAQDQPIKLFMWGSCEVDQYDAGDAPCPEGACRSAVPIPIDLLFTLNESIKSVHCGALHTFLLTTFGRVFSFGCNDDGVLGRSGIESKPELVPLPMRIDLLSTGDSHCVCGNSLYGRLFHWGVFRSTSGNMTKPQREPQELLWDKKKTIEEIVSGSNHCLIRTKEGKVYVCGDPECQVLGRAPGQRRRVQQALEFEGLNLRGVKQVWTGGNHAFVKVQNKKKGVESIVIKAWGSNNYGQLGLGDDELDQQIMIPQDVQGLEHEKVVCIQGGEHHSVAVLDDGSVWVWGRNDEGELGIEIKKEEQLEQNEEEKKKSQYIRIPTKVIELEKVKIQEVISGPTFNFVIGSKGSTEQKVFSWGNGDLYMLANGKDGENERTPYEVRPAFFKKQIVVQLALGAQHGAYLVKENQDIKDPEFDINQLQFIEESQKVQQKKQKKEVLEEDEEKKEEKEEKKEEEEKEKKEEEEEEEKELIVKRKNKKEKKPELKIEEEKEEKKEQSEEKIEKKEKKQKPKDSEKKQKSKRTKMTKDPKKPRLKQHTKSVSKERKSKETSPNKAKKSIGKEKCEKIEEEKQEIKEKKNQKNELSKKKETKKRLHDDVFNKEETKEATKALQKLKE